MKMNKSKSYIVPLLDDFIKIKHVKYIYNSYLFLEGQEEEYIIIQYEKFEELEEYLETLKGNKYLLEIIEREDFYYLVIDVPSEIKGDYSKFLNGNFSEISKKNKIIKFLSSNYGSRSFQAINRIKQVLYKDRVLKEELEYSLDVLIPEESELSSIPSKQSETLKL